MRRPLQVGSKVVYTRNKYTSRPGPRAKNVFATPNGESYEYQVEKYWLVAELRSDGKVVLATRRGKTHVVAQDDPNLRKASLIEAFLKARWFPTIQPSQNYATS